MLLKKIPALIMISVAMLLMASCKKSNTQGRFIPSDASMIVHVNAASLSEKLPWTEVKQNEFFQKMYADTSLSSVAKSALDNPENTGVDIKKDLIFFAMKDSTGTYVAFEGSIKDAAKFKAYNTASLKKAAATQKDGIEYLSTDDVTVSWDNKKFIVVADAPTDNVRYTENPWMDSAFKKLNIDSLAKTAPKTDRNELLTATQLHSLAAKASMSENERFGKLVTGKGDLHFYVNIEGLSTADGGMPGMSMVNMSKLTQGAVATGTANFENGKIEMDLMFYANKEMTSFWKKYAGNNINEDLLKRLPAKDVAVFMAMNFKPEGLKEFLKITGMDGFVSLGAPMLGFSLDDFIKANKGDLVFSVADLAKDSTTQPQASIFFAASVNDKPSFDKLVASGKKFGGEIKSQINTPLFFYYNEQYFSMGNNQAAVDQFVSKQGNSQLDFYKKITTGPIAGYVNMQYIIGIMQADAGKDSLTQVSLTAASKMWDNIMISGGTFKNDGLSQHVEINLVDKSTNSLKQLNQYMGVVGSVAQQKSKELQPKSQGEQMLLPGSTPVAMILKRL